MSEFESGFSGEDAGDISSGADTDIGGESLDSPADTGEDLFVDESQDTQDEFAGDLPEGAPEDTLEDTDEGMPDTLSEESLDELPVESNADLPEVLSDESAEEGTEDESADIPDSPAEEPMDELPVDDDADNTVAMPDEPSEEVTEGEYAGLPDMHAEEDTNELPLDSDVDSPDAPPDDPLGEVTESENARAPDMPAEEDMDELPVDSCADLPDVPDNQDTASLQETDSAPEEEAEIADKDREAMPGKDNDIIDRNTNGKQETEETGGFAQPQEPSDYGEKIETEPLDQKETKSDRIVYMGVDDALEGASTEEKELYESLPLEKDEIDGHEGLKRTDIDFFTLDENGECNLDRMQKGLAPQIDGKSVELHHIGQSFDSPMAELTREEHRGTYSDTILHDKTIPSGIDRNAFNKERKAYWRARAQETMSKETE